MRQAFYARLVTLMSVGAVACSESTSVPKAVGTELSTTTLSQSVVASTLSLPSIAVKDSKGNTMANQALSVTVSAGGGSLSGVPARTSGGAPTALGQWTLGPKVGTQSITVVSGALPPVTISALATAGPPARMLIASAPSATGTVGATIQAPATLQVYDAYDNPADGATVQFEVTGGGQLGSASGVVSAVGAVAVPAWTLGTVRGTNTVTATVGTQTVILSIVAQSDVPASVAVVQGAQQSAFAGTVLPVAPQVGVVDRFGNGVPRQAVAFSVAAGGGSITGAGVIHSDTNGLAAVAGWTLGRRNIAQQLRAAVGGIAVSVDATVRSDFNIEVRFVGSGMTDAQKQLFTSAAERITAFVTGDIPSVRAFGFDVNVNCAVSGQQILYETIDDLVIYASVEAIDGSGQILASAGACGFRGASSNYLPAIGRMRFDSADLATLAGAGSLEDVITHEMLHVVGLSRTFWDVWGHLSGYPGADPRYFGSGALSACRAMGGLSTCATSIPIESLGGDGTAGSHWRESVFGNELMTGYLNSGTNPISAMTIAGFADIGYVVNAAAADSYSLASALRSAPGSLLFTHAWEEILFGGKILEDTPGSVGSHLRALRP
ncbi:MAG: leishmanolysin-related zinc metalloendopeptidase [Gemmatimonadaceae bacterium]|nr:leishmanolysin-related zinc metalloendopeptidase [Gemmatimonadaceae bacterium]